MVVLLIIAILLAIAIPTFLGVTSSANDRAAQSNLTNAFTEASAAYQNNNQSYAVTAPATEATWLATSAPEFTWTTSNSTAQNVVSVALADASADNGQALVLAVLSKPTNTCWVILNIQQTESANVFGIETPGTYYGSFTNAGANCEASAITGTVTAANNSYTNAATFTG